MDNPHVYALDAAKEITVARVQCSNSGAVKASGESAADFYEAVYRKVLELAKESET